MIGIGVGAFIVLILFLLSLWLSARSKSKQISSSEKLPTIMIPTVSKDIKEVVVDSQTQKISLPQVQEGHLLSASEISDTEKEVVTFAYGDTVTPNFKVVRGKPHVEQGHVVMEVVAGILDNGGSVKQTLWRMVDADRTFDACNTTSVDTAASEIEKKELLGCSTCGNSAHASRESRSGDSSSALVVASTTMPEVSQLGWGHWYALHDLEVATNHFADRNVLGEGGYGIVYQGLLPDGSLIAVKNLLNNRGQAEREFRVEVEAIGRVRHKNLVRLLGYCAEGSHRMLVYEYVDNGNLDQWLHGTLGEKDPIPWDGRMKIVLGTAKGLAYLHEDLEPKVVHRDVKSSNILLDSNWNAKVSDFGLAKLLGAGISHVTTRVMGTFGYVAPEYASTGFLTERSDVYSFGVLMMELITGRDPVDYGRPSGEVNLVDWMKMMVGSRRSEEVVDPKLKTKPSARALKRALLVALRCVDPDAQKRPKMGHVIYMLEADDFPFRDVCRNSRDGRR